MTNPSGRKDPSVGTTPRAGTGFAGRGGRPARSKFFPSLKIFGPAPWGATLALFLTTAMWMTGCLPVMASAEPVLPSGPTGKRARVPTPKAGEPSFTFTVLKYGGGGDWYEGLVGAPLFLEFLHKEGGLSVWPDVEVMEPGDPNLFRRRFLYMTGHGEVRFSPGEGAAMKAWLLGGGFLFANDDYGMDPAFRREMAKLFPGKEWVRLGPDHPLFNVYFPFPKGTPKIHEHDGGPPQALALFEGPRMLVLYTFDCDIGDGWAPPEVHGDPESKRLEALKFGVNVVLYAMTGR